MVYSGIAVLAAMIQGHGETHVPAAEGNPWLIWMIPLLPAFGFLFQVFIGTRKLPKPIVGWVSCGVVLASAALSWKAFFDLKAVIVNRIGDLAFTIGVLTLFVFVVSHFNVWTVDFQELRKIVTENSGKVGGVATFVGIMMFIGATGKSAQIPLFTWLPDAMA